MARPRPADGHRVRLAVTGTPGTGKTTLCRLLADQGRTVVGLGDWAATHGAVAGIDAADDADVIDIDALRTVPLPDDAVVDGHLSHLLDVDAIWVVRCDPRVLRKRLEGRGYTPAKVQENLEAEAIDLILQEALAAGPPVVQRDGTHRAPARLLQAFQSADAAIEPVDWSDFLLE